MATTATIEAKRAKVFAQYRAATNPAQKKALYSYYLALTDELKGR